MNTQILTQDHVNRLEQGYLDRRKNRDAAYDRLLTNGILHDMIEELSHDLDE